MTTLNESRDIPFLSFWKMQKRLSQAHGTKDYQSMIKGLEHTS
jgi:hypothetical protein